MNLEPVLSLPTLALVGFTIAVEAQITVEGVRIVVSVKDPRDRTGKIHRGDVVMHTARPSRAALREEEESRRAT